MRIEEDGTVTFKAPGRHARQVLIDRKTAMGIRLLIQDELKRHEPVMDWNDSDDISTGSKEFEFVVDKNDPPAKSRVNSLIDMEGGVTPRADET
jgi:hypothetical protein